MDKKNNLNDTVSKVVYSNEYCEVEYWKKIFGIRKDKLTEAVSSVNNSPEAFRKYFHKNRFEDEKISHQN
jgi:hypothetical protein